MSDGPRLEEPVARALAGATLELRRARLLSSSMTITLRGGEQCFAAFDPPGDAPGSVVTARERWHIHPHTVAGPWVATNADGHPAAAVFFDHFRRNGRIELDEATIEVRHRRWFRGGYDLVFEGARLLSVRRGGGLRVAATLELAEYVPPYPRLNAVLVTACLFLLIAESHSGGG